MKDYRLTILYVLFIMFVFAADYRISKLEEQLLETVKIQKQWKQNLEEKQKTE